MITKSIPRYWYWLCAILCIINGMLAGAPHYDPDLIHWAAGERGYDGMEGSPPRRA
jgi:hypothetical protein